MKSKKLLAIGVAILLSILFSQSLLAQDVPKRDLTRYDDGGIFDFNWSQPQTHERMRAELRDFLWKHWESKALGRVVARFYSYEGDRVTYRLYAEPDALGHWRVVSEYESECCALDKNRKHQRERGLVIYDIVERLEEMKNGKVSWKVIAEGETRESDKYWLRLRRIVDEGSSSKTALIL